MSLTSIKVNNSQITSVDEQPITESNNLVKSGGVYNKQFIKSFIIPANYSNWYKVTSYLKGKKVLMKSSVNGNGKFPIYDSGTTYSCGLYDTWTFYDFTGVQTEWLQLYPSGNDADVIVEYIDNQYTVDDFLNNKFLNVSLLTAAVGRLYMYDYNRLSFQALSDSSFHIFPVRDPTLKGAIQPIDESYILNIDGDLWKWDSINQKYIRFAVEKEESLSIVSSTATSQTISVNIPAGAYLLKGVFDKTCYFAIQCKDAGGNMLAGDTTGNDDNEKSTVPNALYNTSAGLSKYVYFKSPCTSITISNPNKAIGTLTFDHIEDSKEYDLVVAEDGSGQLTSLWDAIKWVGDTSSVHKTIFVKPGRYKMPTQNFNNYDYRQYRNLTIVGADKNACILYNNDGFYSPGIRDNSVLQMSGNVTVKNLTIISSDSELTQGDYGAAYCMHIDYDAFESDNVLIENCIFKNDHGDCVGIGIRPGLTITIKDCQMESAINPKYPSWHGVVAAHDGGVNSGSRKLVFINNVLQSTRKGFSFTGNDYPLDITFIGNAIFKGANEQLITMDGNAGVTINLKTCLNNVTFN